MYVYHVYRCCAMRSVTDLAFSAKFSDTSSNFRVFIGSLGIPWSRGPRVPKRTRFFFSREFPNGVSYKAHNVYVFTVLLLYFRGPERFRTKENTFLVTYSKGLCRLTPRIPWLVQWLVYAYVYGRVFVDEMPNRDNVIPVDRPSPRRDGRNDTYWIRVYYFIIIFFFFCPFEPEKTYKRSKDTFILRLRESTILELKLCSSHPFTE